MSTDLPLVGLRNHLQITEVLTVCIKGIVTLKRASLLSKQNLCTIGNKRVFYLVLYGQRRESALIK